MNTYHIILGQYSARSRNLRGGGYSPRRLETILDLEVQAPSRSAARQLALAEASVQDPAPWTVLEVQEVPA